MSSVSSTDYGTFGTLVATTGCLASATAAIGLAWMKRSKWQPPERTLPQMTSRVSSLVAMVFIASIYVFGESMGLMILAALSIVLIIVTMVTLGVTVHTNTAYSFYYPDRDVNGKLMHAEVNRLLGGNELTEEANHIRSTHRFSETQLLQDAQGEINLVWTRRSIASVTVKSVMSYVVLIAFGTASLAAASMLVVVFTRQH